MENIDIIQQQINYQKMINLLQHQLDVCNDLINTYQDKIENN